MENEPEQHTPTLSVTVLNYNYAHYLPQCLDSILSQTWKDFELILINDRSTDNSLDVIKPYLTDPRIRLVDHAENKGYVTSLIEGAELSRGEYMTVISADDYCISDRAFERLIALLASDMETTFAYSTFGVYGNDGVRQDLLHPHPQSFVRSGAEEFIDLVEAKYFVLHSGTIIRTSAYRAVGGYDASKRYAVDTIMWFMLCAGGKVAYCADELYAYRQHGANMSRNFVGFRDGVEETIVGGKQAIAVMSAAYGITDRRYQYAIQRYLVSVATGTIFSGDYRCGWYCYWRAAQLHPFVTLLRLRTISLLARTALGRRGFDAVRSHLRPLMRRTVPGLSAA